MGQPRVTTGTARSTADGIRMDDRLILGMAIRHARGRLGLSLGTASSLAHLAKSTLQRIEVGEGRATVKDVERLDQALQAKGQLNDLYSALQGRQPLPAFSAHRSTMEASHRWPALWTGAVWVLVALIPPARVPVQISLQWGPWRFDATIDQSTAFETFKAPDDVSVAMYISTSQASDVIFGAGPAPVSDHAIVDIRRLWT
ncbi:helix-turn-helix domain-containing protein [Clavibacter nebraskensis]|uniref:helix-turn-helix domain-containing protein n=1 Tax=Clavibacter nebraskensis TaxID=31963 RepID=UPI003F4B8F6E